MASVLRGEGGGTQTRRVEGRARRHAQGRALRTRSAWDLPKQGQARPLRRSPPCHGKRFELRVRARLTAPQLRGALARGRRRSAARATRHHEVTISDEWRRQAACYRSRRGGCGGRRADGHSNACGHGRRLVHARRATLWMKHCRAAAMLAARQGTGNNAQGRPLERASSVRRGGRRPRGRATAALVPMHTADPCVPDDPASPRPSRVDERGAS